MVHNSNVFFFSINTSLIPNVAGNETTNMLQVCNESSRDMLRAPIQKYSFNWIILWLYLTVEIQLNNMGEKLEWGEKEKETF